MGYNKGLWKIKVKIHTMGELSMKVKAQVPIKV